MRGADESRSPVVPYARAVIHRTAQRTLIVVSLCLGGSFAFVAHARPASASASVTLQSGLNQTRTTIPVTINGQRASCVLDTGSSAVLVSPSLAQAAKLTGRAGTFELAPDGRTYVDRQTDISRLGVAGYTLKNIPALISSNLTGDTALCGYDFLTHFPTLIDRERRLVTLFPSAAKLMRLHCLTIDLSSHVPLATIEINGSRLSHIVLDSGMAGGGALWDGVRTQLRQPLWTNNQYAGMAAPVQNGFACGAVASVRYAAGAPLSSMPICTEPSRPDGYNGIIETNLPTVHALAVDYPHRRICFDIGAPAQVTAAGSTPSNDRSSAWSRFNSLRPPQ
jgi:Aspartyl protease